MSKSEKKSFDEGLLFELLVIILIASYFPVLFIGPYIPKFPMIERFYINLSAIIYIAALICCLKIISRTKKSGFILLGVSIISLIFYVILLFTRYIGMIMGIPITQLLLFINSIIFVLPRRKIEHEKSLYRFIDGITMIIIVIFVYLAPTYIVPA